MVVPALAALLGSCQSTPATKPVTLRPALGVLEANPAYLRTDEAAGIRLAVMNLAWAQWEPQPDVVNRAYTSRMVSIADDYRSHGWKVAIDIGLQTPPAWILHLANGQLVNQEGARSDSPNYEFDQDVRNDAGGYIDKVVATMGQVASYRVGLSDEGEMLYPGPSNNSWWGYDALAQGKATGLPAGVGVSPLPGWVPGQTTWNGTTVTTPQVQAWYDWYLGALTNAHAWEISTYRHAGFAGTLQLVMPGIGTPPSVYAERIAHDLDPGFGDSSDTMNNGSVFWKVLDDLPDLKNTVVDISSVYDPSGSPRGNGCQPGDRTTSLQEADPVRSGWSDTRWLTYLAHAHDLPVIGENPGFTPASNVGATVALARACGLTTLQWAWDGQLNTHSGYASIADLTAAYEHR